MSEVEMEKNISPENFGKKLKRLRKSAKYTQECFSEKIGIEPQNLSRIERGLNFPSLATFIKISQELNIKPNDLLEVDYLISEEDLDNEIANILSRKNLDEKIIIYRILKSFEA